jgi:hypothetical protein
MAKVLRGDQQFLGELIDSLGISLDRVELKDLKTDSEAAQHWELAQSWLEDARTVRVSAKDQTAAADTFSALAPFPLTGTQLRTLQSAVDQAALIKIAEHPNTKSKVQPIVRKALAKPPVTSRARLGNSLNQVRQSSWRLAPILGLLLAINVVEAIFFFNFDNVGSQTIPGTSITLSALTLGLSLAFSILAVGVWLILHYRILSHVRLFHGSAHHMLRIPLIMSLLQALGLL